MLGETGLELARPGLPIPDYLLPPGVEALHTPDHPTSLLFTPTFDRFALRTERKPAYWPEYVDRTDTYLAHRYETYRKQDTQAKHELSLAYADYLGREFGFLYQLYAVQRRWAKNGNFGTVEQMNTPGQPGSLYDFTQKLAPKHFLEKFVAEKLIPLHPEYKKLSKTEIAAAVSMPRKPGHDLPDTIDVKDREAFEGNSRNERMRENFTNMLAEKSDEDLLKLYFGPEEDKCAIVATVKSVHFLGE